MKKTNHRSSNDLRTEYDFATMKGGVRGKYVRRYRAGSNLVLLEPDIAEAFPDDTAVNQALRAVLGASRAVSRRKRPANRALQPTSRVRRRKRKPARTRAARG